MRRLIGILFLLVSWNSLLGQSDMTPGFDLLEKGDFEAAEQFFETYLNTDPDNKTAKICYGRAVGLNGDPERATLLFGALKDRFPNDYEITVNYNESFLWGKQYQTAKPLYKDLVARYPDKFGALLGYANTLSNLKEYEEALLWVDKALLLQPENQSAKVSKKYMRLGYANQFANAQEYAKAEALLLPIFEDFPEDDDVLLNLANLYLLTKSTEKAKAVYWRYATTGKDSIAAMNGIALAEHIAMNDKQALKVASVAKSNVGRFNDTLLLGRTYERYVQALVWNRKYASARQEIALLEPEYHDRNWLRSLKATLGMYTANFKMSLENYGAILEKDENSFDGNLGRANALFASDRIVPAYRAAFQTLRIFKDQKDALGFIEKLNAAYTPVVKDHAAYTFDNGNNVAFSNTLGADIPFSTRFKTSVSYQFRTSENTVTLNKADSHVLSVGADYKIVPNVDLKGVFGINNSRFETSYTQPVIDLKLVTKPLRLQNLEIGYKREVQNFNADLIEREIVMNHYGLNYNLGTNFNLGWYTQAMHTRQTDDNTRNLLFTSLYYSLMRKPALKVGLNYQYISFADQLPTVYFSPEEYQAVELFADMRGEFSAHTTYMASAATGLQQVEQDPQTVIFRAEAGLTHQFGKRLVANLYGKYSNIASATAAGFEFTEVGIKLKWMLAEKPLFYATLDTK
ncbi:tetratricopeptide repeat protein [Pseudozobellia thermophila]|uniref:Tetratricopeptide repeat-containing protein n=1 Tax=Pseudozobellia thermophila TaxID=192903 RepID=A0A1M6I2D2_9FLAO|nr:tetratricopeptide repeat protein [Pseudozobellia thermophila]SHJ28631.1 Tetratricopeptide repeat-containing protein [Pseudozobellia thermophila]